MAKAPRHPIPKFHEFAIGAEVTDLEGNRYRVVGSRAVPLSNLPAAYTRLKVSFRRLIDGETKEFSETCMAVIKDYQPPARVRTRAPRTEGDARV